MSVCADSSVRRTEVLIVGSGGNGMSMAVWLRRAGISDVTIISKHRDFGGTWLQNRYPGLEVDVPSVNYQFSYNINPDWSTVFAKRDELLKYLLDTAKKFDLYPITRFGVEMISARWQDDEGRWLVETTDGAFSARFLVLATGFLEEVVLPDIPGIGDFAGRIFHSSQWPEEYDGTDERIAVIGTGASAVQIVPELQKTAASLTVFQRTPPWVLPKPNRARTEEEMLPLRQSEQARQEWFWRAIDDLDTWSKARITDGERFMEEAVAFMRQEVLDPKLRRVLTPDYHFACKRVLYTNDYLRSLTRPNTTLIPESAASIGAHTITSSHGKTVDVDTIVLTTGYFFGGHVLDLVRRRDGTSVGDAQRGHPRAYKSIHVSGCPNLFLSGGAAPNSQYASGFFCGEAAANQAVKMISLMNSRGIQALEVKESAEKAWKRAADAILDDGPTVRGGCTNYSQDALGHNKAMWPGFGRQMWAALDEVHLDDYHILNGKTRLGEEETVVTV